MILEHSRSMWRFYLKHKAFLDERVPAALRPLILPGIYLRAYVRIARRRFINRFVTGLRRGSRRP
jgi:hypothetical protein